MPVAAKGFLSGAQFNEVAPVGGRVALHVQAQDPFFKLQQQEAAIGRGLDNLAQGR